MSFPDTRGTSPVPYGTDSGLYLRGSTYEGFEQWKYTICTSVASLSDARRSVSNVDYDCDFVMKQTRVRRPVDRPHATLAHAY